MSIRLEKVNNEIRKQLMHIIQEDIDDPVADFLSITRVVTSPDLRETKVYFSLLDENNYDKAKELLDKMNKFIRSRLAKRIYLKTLPSLQFLADDSIKYSVDISKRIDEITEEDRQKHNNDIEGQDVDTEGNR